VLILKGAYWHEELRICDPAECGDCEPASFVRDDDLLRALHSIKGNGLEMSAARELLAVSCVAVHRLDDNKALKEIINLVRSGVLRVCRKTVGIEASTAASIPAAEAAAAAAASASSAEQPPPLSSERHLRPSAAPAKSAPEAETFGNLPVESAHWIEIHLRDEEDQPVANEEYLVTLTDGQDVRGYLDSNGWARFVVQNPGNCKVRFPNIDAEAWKDD